MFKRLYLKFREEKVFLRALCVFVITALTLHYAIGYDADWGGTNLTLSIEAAIASAVIMMEQKRAAEVQQKQLDAILSMQADLQKTLKGVLLIAEAQRDMLIDQRELLQTLKDGDEMILKELTEGEQS